MSIRNSAQCYVAAWMGEGCWGRTDTRICTAESLHSSRESNHNTVNWIYSNKKSKKTLKKTVLREQSRKSNSVNATMTNSIGEKKNLSTCNQNWKDVSKTKITFNTKCNWIFFPIPKLFSTLQKHYLSVRAEQSCVGHCRRARASASLLMGRRVPGNSGESLMWLFMSPQPTCMY